MDFTQFLLLGFIFLLEICLGYLRPSVFRLNSCMAMILPSLGIDL